MNASGVKIADFHSFHGKSTRIIRSFADLESKLCFDMFCPIPQAAKRQKYTGGAELARSHSSGWVTAGSSLPWALCTFEILSMELSKIPISS